MNRRRGTVRRRVIDPAAGRVQRLAASRCVAVDVDGTLLVDGELNLPLVEWVKEQKSAGFEVLLWSAAGRDHAAEVAERFGIADHFSAIISKPGFIVDDLGWTWTKWTRVLTDFLPC